jgi:hypothetical protein
MRKVLPAITCAVALCLFVAAPAQAVAIGPDLNAYTANVTYGCEAVPSNWLGTRFYYASNQPSCTYLASSVNIQNVPQAQFPGGVLTAVRVKTGPGTGPMQASILRATRSAAGFQCCYHAAESQVFTPPANTIATVPVRLPMRNDLDPKFGETVDYLAITVLQPGVPIPMQDFGDPGPDIHPNAASGFWPHVKPGDIRVNGNGLTGLQPLIAGEFTTLCAGRAAAARAGARSGAPVTVSGAPARARTAGGGCIRAVTAAGNRARLRRNRVRIALTCNVGFPCNGKLKLQTGNGKGRTLASTNVNLASNATGTLSAKLSKAGRRLMAGKRKRKVWMNATLIALDGSKVLVAGKVTLQR